MRNKDTSSISGFCDGCRQIYLRGVPVERESIAHSATVDQLLQSQEHCRLCKFFVESFSTTEVERQSDHSHGVWKFISGDAVARNKYSIILHLLAPEDSEVHTILFRASPVPFFNEHGGSMDHLASFDIFTDAGDPAVQLGTPWRRHLPANTSAEQSMETARQWIHGCDAATSQSGVKSLRNADDLWSTTLPALLVHLPVGGRAKLVSASESHGRPYATLSYRWGPQPHPWRTLKRNWHKRLTKGFDVSKMPRTIREALDVTKRLGLDYIWIDALCIIQDDLEDWSRESVKMGSIYARCYINIAADCARTTHDGLYNRVSRSQHLNFNVCESFTASVKDGTPSTLSFYQRSDQVRSDSTESQVLSTIWDQQVQFGPLSHRGWVCQERILSPRTIHFAEDQLFWQCSHNIKCEDNLAIDEARHTHTRHNDYHDFATSTAMFVWRRIVSIYSRCELTFATDKLPALAGIARLVSMHNSELKYLAGIWDDDILSGISWIRVGHGCKVETYRAPSWSWASQDSGVRYEFLLGPPSGVFDAKVVTCKVTTLSENKFGQVIGGSLVLDARLFDATVDEAAGSPRPAPATARTNPTGINFSDLTKILVSNDDEIVSGRAMFDTETDGFAPFSALYLRSDFISHYFILVRSVGDRKLQRVGAAKVSAQYFASQQAYDFTSIPQTRVEII